MESTHHPAPIDSTLRERNELVTRLQAADIFRDYQRSFTAITGLPLVLRAAGSFQLALHGARQANVFCAMMTTRNKCCSACLEMQQRLETASGEKTGTVECFSGLHESAVPVRIGGTVVAFLHTGQILHQAPSAASLRKLDHELRDGDAGADVASLVAAYRESRVIVKSQYEAILRLLDIFAQQLSALCNQLMVKQANAELPAITRARAYVAEHLGEDLCLATVARATGMSSFYFCKTFKKGTGLTFTEYLTRLRIEAVKQQLLNPHKRVSEAAYEAGFQSLSQFNRMFQRIAGESPSAYRDHLHAPARAPSRSPRLAAA